MDKDIEMKLENLLESYSFEGILEECGLTEYEVITILFEQGYINIENEPL